MLPGLTSSARKGNRRARSSCRWLDRCGLISTRRSQSGRRRPGPSPASPRARRSGRGQRGAVLVIDIGGSNIKLLASGQRRPLRLPSGPTLSARGMVAMVRKVTAGWEYSAVSIGYPGPVLQGKPVAEPHNLGPGWVGFNYEKALGRPVKIINDAAMQALGSYRGGRMLFLGLGTGLGTAVMDHGNLQPMELAHLPYKKGRTFEDYVGKRGLKRLGKKKWRKQVSKVVRKLQAALAAEYVVLGGGNARLLKALPRGAQRGDNFDAFLGGFRLWRESAALERDSKRRRNPQRSRKDSKPRSAVHPSGRRSPSGRGGS